MNKPNRQTLRQCGWIISQSEVPIKIPTDILQRQNTPSRGMLHTCQTCDSGRLVILGIQPITENKHESC